MSETPRTDAFYALRFGNSDSIAFARQLERELSAATARERVLRDELTALRTKHVIVSRRKRTLESSLGALGVIGGGYCFCSSNRDPDKAVHQPECRDARAAIGEGK
jgi:hypothetical protein